MPQAYSNPKRENEPHALPDVEYFYINIDEATENADDAVMDGDDPFCTPCCEVGWYWRPCMSGCLPDSDPIGPFQTEAECVADFTQKEDE